MVRHSVARHLQPRVPPYRSPCRKILEKKADYLLAVKGNQPTLQVALQECFGLAQREALDEAGHSTRFIEESHGRFVWQGFWGAANANDVDPERWPGCKMLGMVESLRRVGDKESAPERRYYIVLTQ
ncbi:hypothetical protein [Zoogloea sp. LCSB751]|uniref:hypothetical protein n=1 Tax=Zoogloea sp. LCSB751 TaxID=1965277 RepID=UPI001C1F6E77|nr:hypothetical protein [Zoogloea sp. LCSB751]